MRTFERWSRRLDGLSLAVPMALLLGAALAFALWAMPGAWLDRVIAEAGIDAAPWLGRHARMAIALAGGVAGAVPVWALFRWLERPLRGTERRAAGWSLPGWLRSADAAGEDGAPSLRRADAHPDAPARRPISAASEMGAPLDTVDDGWTPGARWTGGEDAAIVPVPLPVTVIAPVEEPLLLDTVWQPESAVAPEPYAAPAPVAVEPGAADTGATALMARLEAALAARPSGTSSPLPIGVAIDDVMAELRKAVRRG